MSTQPLIARLFASPATRTAHPRTVWLQLWRASRPTAFGVVAWVVASAVAPPLVVVALGIVVGTIPNAIADGLSSPAGGSLLEALVLAAIVYGFSLVLDPIGTALGTAAKARITNELQGRLLTAVSSPIGIDHLEDSSVLDRVARAEGSLTGFFPGDAPVTWAGILASRAAGIIGCIVVGFYAWWLGALLLVMWLSVRRLMLGAIVRQATELRGQTTSMRRAWYLVGVGSKARDAKEMRVFGLPSFIAQRFTDEYSSTITSASVGLRDIHRRAVIGFAVVLAGYLVALSLLAYGTLHGTVDVRNLSILLPMLAVTMSAGSVSLDDITLTWALAAIPDVDSLEQDLARPAELTGSEPLLGRPRERVSFEGVRFHYGAADDAAKLDSSAGRGASLAHTNDVLRGLDLDLVVGTSTAIVGVNGAGKSTLVSLLSRLHDPTSGRITIDGTDARDLDPAQWQRAVAVMPQDPVHYPVSAYDNIAFGAIEHRDDRATVEEVARLAGFADVVPTLPDGWATTLSRELPGGSELSGGQWQRLALARALFATRHGARLLVLDEPTAAMDVRSEARFYDHFLEITEGLTTVVISHRFATVRRADAICVLDGGVITERGSHDELLAAAGTYARMYAVQAKRFGAST